MSQRSRSRIKTAKLFERVVRRCLQVQKVQTVSEWAEQNRVLDDSNSLAGKWSNDITPYLNEIMDTFNDKYIRNVILCKGSQLGGTEAIQNIAYYIVDRMPAPTMFVYPSDDLAKSVSNDRLKPSIRLIPNLRKLFLENQSKELELKFRNMKIYLRGAGSPSKLASTHIKYLFFDEIDKMPGASTKEASPYDLATERTKTFRPQQKVYEISTPTLKTNYIWKHMSEADEIRHYFCKCPNCGEEIELKFKQIHWSEDKENAMSNHERAATAEYICQECGCVITDADKPKMLREGRWKVVSKRGVGRAKSVGYWISSVYSLFLKWSDIAEEFLNDKDDPEKLQNFVNSWLAEPWEDTQLKTSEDLVMERQTDVEQYTVPEWAKIITGGVDVQETSLYYTIRAWGDYTTSQCIAHGQVLSFAEIEEVMNLQYEKLSGQKMVVSMCLIDSGYRPDATYDFCINNADWSMPVKGSSNPMNDRYRISKINKEGSRVSGMPLVIVDGDQIKDSIAARMKRQNGSGSWMVYKGCDSNYAQQVTAEQKVKTKKNGVVRDTWVLKTSHADNHYLDCEVYAMTAAEIMGVRSLHLQSVREEEQQRPEPIPTPEENWIQKNENWMGD